MIANALPSDVLHFVSAPTAASTSRPAIGGYVPTLLCARAIEEGLVPRGRVVLVGDEKSERSARSLALVPHERLTPPLGSVKMLARSVGKIAEQSQRVYVWNDELVPLLKGVRAPAQLISTRPDLARMRVPSRVEIRVFERQDRKAWEAKNQEAEIDSLYRSALDNASVRIGAHTRSSLGIPDDSVCVGVISDRPSEIDARAIGFLIGLLNVSGLSLTAVIPENASHLSAARRHHHGLGDQFRFLIAQEPVLTMLPIFDVLIHPCFNGSGASMLIERICENLGTRVLRLESGGRAGLSRAPGVAGPVIDAIDDIFTKRATPVVRTETESHA
ncbi:MAG: hypothetical protein JJ916_05575 [Phycisphaerales bacterium]|nr:hypothetical protein [Phycisphaerales bacterium]